MVAEEEEEAEEDEEGDESREDEKRGGSLQKVGECGGRRRCSVSSCPS